MALMKRRDLLKAAAMALGSVRESRAAADTNRQINTVLGPIPPSELGPTLTHEHVLVDIVGAGRIAPGRYDGGEVAGAVLPHLKQLRSQGCRTFVDCTPAYLGRAPALLARLAQSSGLHILTNTGFYGAAGGKYVPEFAFSATAEDLAARWTGEFESGIPPMGIRPALIKIGVDAGPLSKMNGKLVSAAALTHLRTGMVIASHTGDGLAAMAQLNLLKSHGVSPAAFIWVHAQDEKDRSFHRKAAEAGAWIGFDGISSQTVDQNIDLIRETRRAGYLGRVLISQDVVGFHVGEERGGYCPGYTFLFSGFLPQLRKSGLDEAETRMLTIENPRRALTQGV
jgi:predicted metal-dependent phosphotriesterase family hydrolase